MLKSMMIFFSGGYSDATGSGLDEIRTSLELGGSEPNTNPCNEHLFNFCRIDTRYEDLVDPATILPKKNWM